MNLIRLYYSIGGFGTVAFGVEGIVPIRPDDHWIGKTLSRSLWAVLGFIPIVVHITNNIRMTHKRNNNTAKRLKFIISKWFKIWRLKLWTEKLYKNPWIMENQSKKTRFNYFVMAQIKKNLQLFPPLY